MTRCQVRLARSARRQVRTIQAWWSDNRPAAPDLFRRELAAVLERLA